MSPSVPSPTGRAAPEAIVRRLFLGGPAIVALSGGVDSSLVASFAHEALGAQAVAITLTGPAVSSAEVERACELASSVGIAHRLVRVDPLANEAYVANPSNRCFFCRSIETEALLREGALLGARQYLDGIQLDDLGDYRPGLLAMDRAGFLHPLLSAGWCKHDVRAEARLRRLPTWDAPSEACLASRVAHGERIDEEILRRIEKAEAMLHAKGFGRVRVRVSGGSARVEVDPQEVARLLEHSARVEGELAALGFDAVTIDPAGYRPAARGPIADRP